MLARPSLSEQFEQAAIGLKASVDAVSNVLKTAIQHKCLLNVISHSNTDGYTVLHSMAGSLGFSKDIFTTILSCAEANGILGDVLDLKTSPPRSKCSSRTIKECAVFMKNKAAVEIIDELTKANNGFGKN